MANSGKRRNMKSLVSAKAFRKKRKGKEKKRLRWY
jgi:hypothetical protein